MYFNYVGIFFVLMAILCLVEVREQASFQVMMTGIRGLVIITMVSTLAFGEASDFGVREEDDVGSVEVSAVGADKQDPLPLIRWSGLPSMLPIAVFCQLFQVRAACKHRTPPFTSPLMTAALL